VPAARPEEINQAIIAAIEESGGTIYSISTTRNPGEFIISYDGTFLSIWIYAWTLTHGGRANLPHEYRIQLTGVKSPLALNPNPAGTTILLGYEPLTKMLAGFDVNRHRNFTEGSPSVQIDMRTLDDARANGVALDLKANREIAVALRPDHFILYCERARELHESGSDPVTLAGLQEAVTQPATEAPSIAEREQVVHRVARFRRLAGFRRKVLQAYDYRCAVTRCQLDLAQAAHILPVPHPRSTDEVRNGIALSPTYHRAFDTGLIYLDNVDGGVVMRLNPRKLHQLSHQDGLEFFAQSLGRAIHLPRDRSSWPVIDFIRLANEFRGIPS
jgi:putative restriction endonuclease